MMSKCVDMFSVFNVFLLFINSIDWKYNEWATKEQESEREKSRKKQRVKIQLNADIDISWRESTLIQHVKAHETCTIASVIQIAS